MTKFTGKLRFNRCLICCLPWLPNFVWYWHTNNVARKYNAELVLVERPED